jgi:hypothetical protein
MAQTKTIDLGSIAADVGVDAKTARRRLRAAQAAGNKRLPTSTAENRWRFASKDRRNVEAIIAG